MKRVSRPPTLTSRKRPFVGLGVSLGIVALFACDNPAAPVPAECAVALSATSAAPGKELVISGISADPASAGVVFSAGQAVSPAPVRVDETGALRVMVPLHPAAGAAGGRVRMTVYAGTSACRAIDMEIQPLAAAPGTTRQLLADLDRTMEAMARISGVEPEALAGDPSQLPPHLMPIVMAQRLLGHPGNPNSVRAMLAGTAPVLEGVRADGATLDALLEASGAAAAIRELADSLVRIPTAPAEIRASMTLYRAEKAAAPVAGPNAASGIVMIRSAEELDYWMRMQQSYAGYSTQQSQRFVALASQVAALLSMAPVPYLRAAGAGTAVTIFAVNLYTDGHKSLLPSKLDTLEVAASLTRFSEGDLAVGQWSGARLTASGERWTLTLPTLVDGLMNGLGMLGGFTSAIKGAAWIGKAERQNVTNTMEDAVNAIVGTVNTVAGVEMNWDGVVGVAGPYTYGPVDVQNARWTRAGTDPAGVVEIRDRTGYAPVAAGRANLVVSTVPGRFAGKIAMVRIPVEVVGINLVLLPTSAEVRPNGRFRFQATVQNAVDERVNWSVTGAGSISQDGVYTAPLGEGTYTVTAASAAKPDRKATATIHVVDKVIVRITPANPVALPGGRVSFSALVEGAANSSVTWTATAGSITAAGVYTAPQELGTYTVTARSVADANAFATASVLVSDKAPQYSITDLGTLPNATYVLPVDLNHRGRVIGWVYEPIPGSDEGHHIPFIWENGQMRRLPDTNPYIPAGSRGVIPTGINDHGQISLQSTSWCNGTCRGGYLHFAHLWTNGSSIRLTSFDANTTAVDVNNSGDVLLSMWSYPYSNTNELKRYALVHLADGNVEQICANSVGNAQPARINDRGSVIGVTWSVTMPGNPSRATPFFCRRGTTMPVPLDDFAPSGLNERDQLSGTTPNGAAIWENGAYRYLPALPGGSRAGSSASGLNDHGDAFGTSDGKPVLWRDGRVYEIRALIPAESGWSVDRVIAINDNGWMIGEGTYRGQQRAFVMRPL